MNNVSLVGRLTKDAELRFEHKQNYQVSGYQRIEPVTQEQLNELCGW